MKQWHWLIVGIVAAAVIYQFGFRYQYYEYLGTVQKIDRLTGTACFLPCKPIPAATEEPLDTLYASSAPAASDTSASRDLKYLPGVTPTPSTAKETTWTLEQTLPNGLSPIVPRGWHLVGKR